MTRRDFTRVLAVLSFAALVPLAAAAQGDVPQTAWGHPDLQGVWDFRTITRWSGRRISPTRSF